MGETNCGVLNFFNVWRVLCYDIHSVVRIRAFFFNQLNSNSAHLEHNEILKCLQFLIKNLSTRNYNITTVFCVHLILFIRNVNILVFCYDMIKLHIFNFLRSCSYL